MLHIKFKVEECDDDIYNEDEEDESEGKEAKKDVTDTVPVILSCVGWNAKNLARAAGL